MKRVWPSLMLLYSLTTMAGGTEYTMPMSYQDSTRQFIVHLPTGYTPGMHLPVVFNLHGYGSNAPQELFYTRMDVTADANQFICVFPEGLNSSWNSGFALPYNSYPDDVGFISKIIDTLYELYSIDLTRVYACGMSNGGFQSYRLACDLENRIAAIASVTGTLSDLTALNCALSRHVPVLEIHGTADPLVDYNGSTGYYAVEQTIQFWVSQNQCSTVSDTVEVPDTNTTDSTTVQEIRYRNCGNGTEVWLYKVAGGGHSWPGATIDYIYGPTNRDINASQEIWDFFSRFTLNGNVNGMETLSTEAPKVTAFPNPTNGLVTLTLSGLSSTESVVAELLDVTGRKILQQPLVSSTTSFRLNGLPNGVYLLKLEGSNFSEVKKIIKSED